MDISQKLDLGLDTLFLDNLRGLKMWKGKKEREKKSQK
jgi:hypothetical protein